MNFKITAVIFAFTCLLGLNACGGGNGGGLSATLSACPEDSTVTWEQVTPVFQDYCTSCHHSDKVGTERVGATPGVDYDTPELAYNSEASPASTWSEIYTGDMPPGDSTVPEAEAILIHDWLSCGGPQ